mgnify:CR=1 FL=1
MDSGSDLHSIWFYENFEGTVFYKDFEGAATKYLIREAVTILYFCSRWLQLQAMDIFHNS